MNAALKIALIASMTLTSLGCAGSQIDTEHPSSNAENKTADGWVDGPVDLRKVTVLVKVTPPPQLRDIFVKMSAIAPDPDFGAFLETFANGGSGSGFVMVRRQNNKDYAFIVTNRHVVDQAVSAEVTFSDGSVFSNCTIVHTDDDNDLAVLAFPQGNRPVSFGLRPAASPPSDRQTVIATGFPGLVGKPSYQTTEGKISNASFTLELGKTKNAFIQHTAPIDPGSSGGPLTSERGELLGVNTMFLRNRHSAFFAVPASAVEKAIDRAIEIERNRESAGWKKAKLVDACRVLTGELGSHNPKFGIVEEMISNRLVAEQGLQSIASVIDDERFLSAFTSDPMDGMRKAVLLWILLRTEVSGGMSPTNSCQSFVASDEANIASADTVRQQVEMGKGRLELTWTFEHGHWRLADAQL